MTSAFADGFQDELVKLGFGSGVHQALLRAQLAVARRLLGSDPRVPSPFAESALDDSVSRMRLEQRLVDLNRAQMGLGSEPDPEKTAMLGFLSPRTARRVVQNTGYDERDPGFRAMAHQLTGESDLNRMTQYQLKTLVSIITGRPA
jgi:hypothetical protein